MKTKTTKSSNKKVKFSKKPNKAVLAVREVQKNFKGERMLNKAQPPDSFWAYNTKGLPKDEQLLLLDNVQFIYELALAKLELQAIGASFEMTNGLREFKLLHTEETEEDEEMFRKKLAYFKIVKGKYTDYFQIIQKNRTRSVNQYLTHWIYPYKGKFHPQMIRALMNIIGLERGDTVLDPFVGSGTAAVEAQLLGINFIGVDVSPLCVLQSGVKTESIYALSEILEWKQRVITKMRPHLFNINEGTIDNAIDAIPDEKVRNFYNMAKLVAVSDTERRGRVFSNSFLKNLEVMIASVEDYVQIVKKLGLKLGKVDIRTGDARALPLKDGSIDGIITSPPYSLALDYVSNDAHALKELGCNVPEIREEFIGVRGRGDAKIDLYDKDLEKSMEEMHRVLKPNKYAVIVIGNATYQGHEVKTVEFTMNHAERIGFKLVKNIDKIIFGLYNVMLKENILIFKKQ